jgi:NAD(P)-dependent dehydrogenase (short-subunit alcohol dehydrogenase family)
MSANPASDPDGGHVLVVGGTKGLGRVVVERFLARACRITVVARHPPADLHLAARVHHVEVDLETMAEATTVVAAAVAQAGPLRYVVFCQRYRGQGDPWQGELQVSVRATDLLIRAATDAFEVEAGVDRAIAVVSSVYAEFVGGSQPASYHVAKAGLNQLVKYYAWALGARGLRINAVMPLTYQKAESRQHYVANQPLMDLYRRIVPLGRMGTADDSANLIDFLCSGKAGFLTGQCIAVDGGVSVVWGEELARRLTGI